MDNTTDNRFALRVGTNGDARPKLLPMPHQNFSVAKLTFNLFASDDLSERLASFRSHLAPKRTQPSFLSRLHEMAGFESP
jgi:hypothetical protein